MVLARHDGLVDRTGFDEQSAEPFARNVPEVDVPLAKDPSGRRLRRPIVDDAREIVVRLRTITSVIIPDASYLRNPTQRDFYLSGLRVAAGENH